MRVSEPILPMRMYDDLFDQQRFNSHCHNAEQFDLVYPPNGLPHFQLKREAQSPPTLPTGIKLRNVCDDDVLNGYYKEIPEPASNFGDPASFGDGINPGFYTLEQAEIKDSMNASVIDEHTVITQCNKLKSQDTFTHNSPGAPVATVAGPYGILHIPVSTIAGDYHFKIIVEKFLAASNFEIRIYAGTSLQGTITAAGIYNYDFTLAGGTPEIQVVFYKWDLGDIFEISYAQATLITWNESGDIDLDTNDIHVVGVNATGNEIVCYCKSNNQVIVPPGEYYYILVYDDGYYFSEVFKVISFKEIENYYKLNWLNSDDCDINDSVCYNTATLGCVFRNIVYLDASLFKPEPQTKEEGPENGDGDQNSTFLSWKKQINFEVLKCPEFLTDALSAIFLHDLVYLTPPINKYQDVQPGDITVKKVVSEVGQVLSDCFQKVNLKLLMTELYTESACCDTITP